MVKRFFLFLAYFFFQGIEIYAIEGFDFSTLESTTADFKVVVKNVGQGSCTILKNQFNGKHSLIDGGSSASTPLNLVDDIAKDLGGASINEDLPPIDNDITFIVSHTDQDHVDYLHRVFSKNTRLFAQSPQILLGDHLANYYKSSDSRTLLHRIIGNLRNPYSQASSLSHSISFDSTTITAETGDIIDTIHSHTYLGYREHISINEFLSSDQVASGHSFEILSVNAGAGTKDARDENTNSAVVRLGIKDKNILIMGDATGLTTRRILLTPKNLECLETELLVSSHHGSKVDEANNGLWLGTIKPKRVAISAGYHGGYKHPHAEFLMDLMIIKSLSSSKPHPLALSGPEENLEFYNLSVASHAKLEDILEIQNKEKTKTYKWLKFAVSLSIHSTGSSGSLYYIYNSNGELVHFWSENHL